MPNSYSRPCHFCGADLNSALSHLKPKQIARRKFCNRSCLAKSNVKSQQAWEQGMAKAMEEDGWRIIRPMSCCDRIGIKNGKVYFIEFKPAGNTKLRFYQKAVRKLVPDVYCVVVGSNDQNPKILGINDKWVGSPDFHPAILQNV